MRIIQDVSYDRFPECKLDLYLPDCPEYPVLIMFHGGGLETGDKREESNLYEILVERGVAVASADYRMYPSARYPEFIEDAAAAVGWVDGNIGKFGNCRGIFIGGSSAGAYLAMMLCFDKKYLAARQIDSNSITGYIFNSAQPTTHFNVLRERGLDTRRVVADVAAPIYHISENSDAAPMLILVADNDIPNRLEQTVLFYNTLKLFGYDEAKISMRIMKGYEHCGYNQSTDGEGKNIFAGLILDFIANTPARNKF